MKLITATLFLILWFSTFNLEGQQPLKLNGKKFNLVSTSKTNVYASKYEATNFDYLEFLYWTKLHKDKNAYNELLPDTLKWSKNLGYREKYIKYYLRHPGFRNYPLVNVSFEQANAYCAWLTAFMNENLDDKHIKKIVYRLPTEEEWEQAARGHLNEKLVYSWESSCQDESGNSSSRLFKRDSKNSIQANCTRGRGDYMGVAGDLIHGADITLPVDLLPPNTIGLYNVCGNVKEMTSEKGINKGGAWDEQMWKLKIPLRDLSDAPECNIGFRVFAEIEEYHIKEPKKTLTAKKIDKNCFFVEDSNAFYMYNYEVSNAEFAEFLNSIVDPTQKRKYTPLDSNWSEETDLRQYLHYFNQFPDHPVVNIDKPTMNAFCIWLTEKYNKDPKRKFDKVRIALPSFTQWKKAPNVEKTRRTFAYGGPYVTDEKGNYLVNHNPLFIHTAYDERRLMEDSVYRKSKESLLKKSRNLDGYELTAPVKSIKTSIEAHHLNGNVAEVLRDESFTVGGSFASMIEYCKNISEDYHTGWPLNEYGRWPVEYQTLPSPRVGFRFVVEVLNP